MSRWARSGTLSLAACAIFMLSSGFQLAARVHDLPGDYFPDGTFSHFETEEWFGPWLSALDEPSLYRLAGKSSASIYRVTVLPPFDACFTLTLYVQPDGTGRLELKKAAQIATDANSAGYGPGPILRRATFLLSRNGVRRFGRLLAEIDFWHLSSTPPLSTITDANTFLYEAASDGRYHVIEIEDPGSPALLPPARYLVELVGEKMPE